MGENLFAEEKVFPHTPFPKALGKGSGEKRMLSEQCKCKYIVVDWLSSSVW